MNWTTAYQCSGQPQCSQVQHMTTIMVWWYICRNVSGFFFSARMYVSSICNMTQ